MYMIFNRLTAYRLTSDADPVAQPILKLVVQTGGRPQTIYLPNGLQASWIMPPHLRDASLRIESNDLTIEALSPYASLLAFMRGKITLKRKNIYNLTDSTC